MRLHGRVGRAAPMRQSSIARAPCAVTPAARLLSAPGAPSSALAAAAISNTTTTTSSSSSSSSPACVAPRRTTTTTSPLRHQRRVNTTTTARAGGLFGGLFKQDPSENTRRKYAERVERVNALEAAMAALDDAALRAKTAELRKRAMGGESLDALLPEAFAVSFD
jgi:hypothetical protein